MSLGINYKLVKHIATLSTRTDQNDKTLNTELNIISWNDRAPVYDIREWDEHHNRMSYGVKLSESEMLNLYNALKENEAAVFER